MDYNVIKKSEVKKLLGLNVIIHKVNEVINNENSDSDFQIFNEWRERFVDYQEGMYFRGSSLLERKGKYSNLEGTMKQKESIYLISSLRYT